MYTNINQTPDYENLQLIHKNALPSRAYFIPAKDYEECYRSGNGKNRAMSSRFFLLSGEWQFHYYTSPALIEKEAVQADNQLQWDKIRVPSCWQCYGYEPPFYVNNDFTCPAIPPYVPNANPVGVYKRKFHLPKQFGEKVYLTFLGVATGFHVFLNGREVGYSQGTHNMSEFDITDFLCLGENDLTVFCYKWCCGIYLESQDMFRYNGIFRDVYLTGHRKTSLYDFEFSRHPLGGSLCGEWECRVKGVLAGDPEGEIEIVLLDGQKKIAETKCAARREFEVSFRVTAPALWNAEQPNVYRLFIRIFDRGQELECVSHYVGFKTIDFSGPAFKVNGVPIKIKGVNHHDTTPDQGYVMTYAQLEKDVRLMKAYNVNTVRTSHYPPDPCFLELCDLYGLYVIDEADLESYGSLSMKDGMDYFGKNPAWKNAFLDRMEKLYSRDRNHASLIMWSLGNEAGVGENFDAAYAYLKEKGSGIPIQYETCFRGCYDGEKGYDIVSLMYPPLALIEEWMNKPDSRPFYLCEYCHAMGLGPGSFKEYWDLVYRHEKFIGGCVWEWADHAVYHENGPYRYTYGGDHGEYYHDGNFCCDGLFYPDRTPSTSAYEMKNTYRPVHFNLVCAGSDHVDLEVFNTRNFSDTSGDRFRYALLKDGAEASSGACEWTIAPYTKKIVRLPIAIPQDGEIVLNIFTNDDSGNEIGTDSLLLRESPVKVPVLPQSDLKISETDRQLTIKNGIGELVFDKYLCTFTSFVVDGTQLLHQSPVNEGYGAFAKNIRGFYLNLWRPVTDNDLRYKQEWYDRGYDKMWTNVRHCEIECGQQTVTIRLEGFLSPPKYSGKFRFETEYRVDASLRIHVTSVLHALEKDLYFLPKFGMMVCMPKAFDVVEWYGKGEHENYSDMQESVRFGIFRKRVSELRENYIVPQESGNREMIRWVKFRDANGNGLAFYADGKALSFNASHYSMKDIDGAKHREDLLESDMTEVHIDGFVGGIGSNSCGEPPLEQYRVIADPDAPLRFSYVVVPLSCKAGAGS